AVPWVRGRACRSNGFSRCLCPYGRLASLFFQAEDGIRGRNVTGVQTCALPIFPVGYLTESSLFPTPNTFPYHCLQSSKLSSFFLLLILYQQRKSLILPTRFDNRGFVFPYNF